MNSRPVTECLVCGSKNLESVFWLGYLPPVNTLQKIGEPAVEEPHYPAELLQCKECSLAQLGCVVDKEILFPACYSYTSGTTQMLKDNFADLCKEVQELGYGKAGDLVVDIGSNDGTLLENFKDIGFRVIGIEPTDAADIAILNGIPTAKCFFPTTARLSSGPAQIVTACNVFAHMPDVHGALDCVLDMLADDGVFVVEVQYLPCLQYDTVYHEHCFYWSLKSLSKLFEMHGMEIINSKRIPTHGGSIRVYSSRIGENAVRLHNNYERDETASFETHFTLQKKLLWEELVKVGVPWRTIYGIGAPSRAATLVNYVGLDGILDCICELPNSKKIGHYMPGTRIPIVDEKKLYEDAPEYAMLLSWHLGDGLMDNLRQKGFRGKFVIPLPTPRIVE